MPEVSPHAPVPTQEGVVLVVPSERAAVPWRPENALALDSIRAELARMDPKDLAPINIDVFGSAIIVLGAAPKIREHRDAMVEWFGEDRAALVDRLETLASATIRALVEQRRACTRASDLAALSRAAREQRQMLVADLNALVARKRMDPRELPRLSGKHGYKNMVRDLLLLTTIFRDAWDDLDEHTGLTMAEVDRAEGLASDLATAYAVRESAPTSPTADVVRRAFTLLLRTYDEVLRMLGYLRWHEGDADRIAPSLWAGRRGRKRRAASGETPPQGEAVTPALPGPPVRPGLPGASPFVEG